MQTSNTDRRMPPVPFNEAERMRALLESCILDTPPDPAFDEITQFAARTLQAPIAAVSLIDQHRQWFKSKVGVQCDETTRQDAFCAYTILQREPLIVLDARQDPRFCDSPLVNGEPGVRFYLGVPIRSEDGMPLGALCVVDTVPRKQVSPVCIAIMEALAANIEQLIRAQRVAGYIDKASGYPNQRRYRENGASLNLCAAPGSNRWWAVAVEAVDASEASAWIDASQSTFIDRRIELVGRWLAVTGAARDGIYRLSARHLAFFVETSGARAVQTLTEVLHHGLAGVLAKDRGGRSIVTGGQPVRSAHMSAFDDMSELVLTLLSPLAAARPLSTTPPVTTLTQGDPLPASTALAASVAAIAQPESPVEPARLLQSIGQEAVALPLGRFSAAAHRDAVWIGQPCMDLASGECTGFNIALTDDWRTRTDDIERLLLRFARWCEDHRRPQARMQFEVAANITLRHGIGDWLRAASDFGVQTSQIDMTLPLSALHGDFTEARDRVRVLRDIGVGVTVTGFGSGFDMLGWLPSLAFSAVRFDPRLIDAVQRESQYIDVAKRLASLVHGVGGRVMAHALNTHAAVDAARLLGCDEGSGSAFGGPAHIEAMTLDALFNVIDSCHAIPTVASLLPSMSGGLATVATAPGSQISHVSSAPNNAQLGASQLASQLTSHASAHVASHPLSSLSPRQSEKVATGLPGALSSLFRSLS